MGSSKEARLDLFPMSLVQPPRQQARVVLFSLNIGDETRKKKEDKCQSKAETDGNFLKNYPQALGCYAELR